MRTLRVESVRPGLSRKEKGRRKKEEGRRKKEKGRKIILPIPNS
jgi:hypothetical protein